MTLSLEPLEEGHHHRHLSCPECGINSVVQHGSVYVCLNCGFRRNISEPDQSISAMVILAFVAFFLLIFMTTPEPSSDVTPAWRNSSSQRF